MPSNSLRQLGTHRTALTEDVVRLRTNYRTGEDVYLFHTTAGPAWSRSLFLEYLRQLNQLHDHPRWYNALTNNCTTNIYTNKAAADGSSKSTWDWRNIPQRQSRRNGIRERRFRGDAAICGA
jgi:Domain of unknown function (DUF4105)